MTYKETIEEAFTNIINTCSKLSYQDKGYVIRQLQKLTNHINRQEADIKINIEKTKGLPSKSYDDVLDFYMDVMYLHGYNQINIGREKYKNFIKWFNRYALCDDRFKPKNITSNLIDTFADAYVVFELNFERDPKDYAEFRNFVLNYENEIEKDLKAQLSKVEGELSVELDKK